jgi:hypothetical protein
MSSKGRNGDRLTHGLRAPKNPFPGRGSRSAEKLDRFARSVERSVETLPRTRLVTVALAHQVSAPPTPEKVAPVHPGPERVGPLSVEDRTDRRIRSARQPARSVAVQGCRSFPTQERRLLASRFASFLTSRPGLGCKLRCAQTVSEIMGARVNACESRQPVRRVLAPSVRISAAPRQKVPRTRRWQTEQTTGANKGTRYEILTADRLRPRR